MRGMWIIRYMLKWPGYLKYQLRIAKRPFTLTLFITKRCNSRCIMCNFWKSRKDQDEITVDEIRKLLKHDTMKHLDSVGISGGEIFMRKDLPEIIGTVHDITGIKPHICTNGIMTAQLDRLMETKGDKISGVMISVDGLSRVHDMIRGKGTFDATLKSIRLLKEKYNVTPTINMTLNKYNYKDLLKTYDFFNDCIFTYKIASRSAAHFGDNSGMEFGLDRRQKERVIRDARKLPNKNMYDMFIDEWVLENKRPLPCYAGLTSMFINPDGTVQPCLHKPRLGNIREASIEGIWLSKKAKTFRKMHRRCQDCYERCTVDTFRIDLPKWAIKSRLKRMMEKREVKNN